MKSLTKTIRIACYVCALPLLATAVAAAHSWMSQPDDLALIGNLETVPSVVADANRAHLLAADTSGNLHGRIISLNGASAENLKVYFVANGEIEQSTVTEADGSFRVAGLVAGPYSLVAAGANGLVAHGVYVTTDAAEATEQPVALQTAAVGPQFDDVVEFISEHAVPEGAVVEQSAQASELDLSTMEGSNKVLLSAEGSLEGRLVGLHDRIDEQRDYSQMSARLMKADVTIADIAIDADGSFVIEKLEPGIYDLVAAGDQGFAAISFEAIAEPAESAPASNASYTSTVAGFHRHLDCCLAPPIDCAIVYEQVHYAHDCYIEQPVIVEEIVIEEPLPVSDIGCGAAAGCNFGCGGQGDYGGCCGGGGGGFGDFGGLIGAAIGALILAEVIDQLDDDDNVIRQPVVIPPIIIPPIISPR